ncbi:MAG TPA: hypothetical protein VJ972_14360 [Anaerolineales bacterium]|nr:hypothetical protein [Anaerolineales bacterium]
MNTHTFSSLDHSCNDVLHWTREQLTQAGLRSVQTFDLHAARTGLRDCPCPNHGTDDCDCQFVVLLVYGNVDTPETLILHGNGEKTSLSISDTFVSHVTGSLAELIKVTLMRQEFNSTEILK